MVFFCELLEQVSGEMIHNVTKDKKVKTCPFVCSTRHKAAWLQGLCNAGFFMEIRIMSTDIAKYSSYVGIL